MLQFPFKFNKPRIYPSLFQEMLLFTFKFKNPRIIICQEKAIFRLKPNEPRINFVKNSECLPLGLITLAMKKVQFKCEKQ